MSKTDSVVPSRDGEFWVKSSETGIRNILSGARTYHTDRNCRYLDDPVKIGRIDVQLRGLGLCSSCEGADSRV